MSRSGRPRLEVPMMLRPFSAGLGALLDGKLAGTPAALGTRVEEQHQRLALTDRAVP